MAIYSGKLLGGEVDSAAPVTTPIVSSETETNTNDELSFKGVTIARTTHPTDQRIHFINFQAWFESLHGEFGLTLSDIRSLALKIGLDASFVAGLSLPRQLDELGRAVYWEAARKYGKNFSFEI